MSRIQVGHYIIIGFGDVWRLHVKDIDSPLATCDWTKPVGGVSVSGRIESVTSLEEFYDNSEWTITRVEILPDELFVL